MDVVLTSSGPKTSVRPLPRLRDTPGTVLRLMVVSTGRRHCAGIDLASGALVRAWSPAPVDPRLCPYELVEVTIAAGDDVVPDPCEPEAVVTQGPPTLAGRLTGRRARRLFRPLLHPSSAPLLGFYGPAVPFWERKADHPSIALVEPMSPLVVTVEGGALWCRFKWAGLLQVLQCTDPRLGASLERSRMVLARLSPGTVLLVALEPPVEGQCQKVVEAVIPRR